MDDGDEPVMTSTGEEFPVQTNHTLVLTVDQSLKCPDDQVDGAFDESTSASHAQSNPDDNSVNSSDNVESDHFRNVEKVVFVESSTDEGSQGTNAVDSKKLSNELILDHNVDANVAAISFSNEKLSSYCDSTDTYSKGSNILSTENNLIDSSKETNNFSPAFPDCISFDKLNYAIDFVNNAPEVAKKDSIMASDLISSETMSDFFDEIYDVNYGNHYRNRKFAESDNQIQSRFRSDNIDGTLREEDWRPAINEPESCSYLISHRENDAGIKSSLKRSVEVNSNKEYLPVKKSRRGITFDSVSVYYFPRTQGFTCIPSQGGSTLGMSWNHSHSRKFSLGEHAAEQRRAHRQLCSQQLASSRNWNELSNVSSEDSDSDEIISDSEVDYENYNFLQPIPTRERRAMLRAAGIHKIDSREKDECRSIRSSREFCGCTCQVYCDPERCLCAQAGIKCQVDRMNFPCSCSREGCANENGRIEFNPVRVRTHYIHTLMRLEMERKTDEEGELDHRLLLSGVENAPQLSPYPVASVSTSSASSSSAGSCLSSGNILTTFSYHSEPLSYYGQSQEQASLPSSSAYNVTSSAMGASETSLPLSHIHLPPFDYGSPLHQYTISGMVAADDSISSYSQLSTLSTVSSLALLGENSGSSMPAAASEYSLSGEQCLRLASSAGSTIGDSIIATTSVSTRSDYDGGVNTLCELQQTQDSFPDVPVDVTGATAVPVPVSVAAATAITSSTYHGNSFMRLPDDTLKEPSFECASEGEILDTSAEVSEETEKEEESDLENFGDIIKKTMVESVIA